VKRTTSNKSVPGHVIPLQRWPAFEPSQPITHLSCKTVRTSPPPAHRFPSSPNTSQPPFAPQPKLKQAHPPPTRRNPPPTTTTSNNNSNGSNPTSQSFPPTLPTPKHQPAASPPPAPTAPSPTAQSPSQSRSRLLHHEPYQSTTTASRDLRRRYPLRPNRTLLP
jgi:hypothetical protein